MERLLIGVAGGSGSGKTTLIQNLRNQFIDDVSLLHLDDYYKCNDDLSLQDRQKLDYDHPKSFDLNLLTEHLKLLKSGQAVESPQYDFRSHSRQRTNRQVLPSRVILLEGVFLLIDRRLRELLDVKIFVDTDSDVRALRRVQRDVNERGCTLEQAISIYLTRVKPMHEMFVEPSRHFADLVVLEGGANQVAADMMIAKIRSHLDTK